MENLNLSSPARPVCILGCGRSGTSIFGELFQSLTPYQYFSEPEWTDFAALDFSSPTAIKVPRPGPSTTPGLPFLLETFHSIFPSHGVIFWQVRHPLDTICSLKVGISKDWGHHPRPEDYQEWQDRSLVAKCAHHWNYLNTVGFEKIQKQAVVNRFEDMIRDPLKVGLTQTEVTGLDPKMHADEIRVWANRIQDENNDKFVEADCSKPYSRQDHVKKVGRWKENLSKEEIEEVLPIVDPGAKLFDYDLEHVLEDR